MNHRTVVVLVSALFFVLMQAAGPSYATKPRSTLPHKIEVRVEPESVSVGSTTKVILTFIPCVDVENLRISLYFPHERGAKALGPQVQKWSGNRKKGQAITLSGLVVFDKPGLYLVGMTYTHPDPKFHLDRIGDAKRFWIRVPGGIETHPSEYDSPAPGGQWGEQSWFAQPYGRSIPSYWVTRKVVSIIFTPRKE